MENTSPGGSGPSGIKRVAPKTPFVTHRAVRLFALVDHLLRFQLDSVADAVRKSIPFDHDGFGLETNLNRDDLCGVQRQTLVPCRNGRAQPPFRHSQKPSS